MSSFGEKEFDAKSKVPNKAYRDGYDKIFKKVEEFCRYCGAGIGKFRREGEGTCHKCEGTK